MIKNISVLGAGTMGHGIAEYFAAKGYPVKIFEPYEPMRKTCKELIRTELEFLAENDLLEKEEIQASLDRISITDDLRQAVENADYVIEALKEDIEVKKDIFEKLEQYTKEDCICASNTSSLSLEQMLEKVGSSKKTKCMVCHWYNPPHLMPLVELSYFGNMDEDTFDEVSQLYTNVGKQVCKIKKDIPGLVANRIQQGVAREVFSLIEQGVADPEDIETALMFGPAFRYATTGQLEIVDLGGLDIWCTVGDNLLSFMDNQTSANKMLREKVEEGKLGVKSGEGFFKYSEGKADEMKAAFEKRLIMQLRASQNYIK